jgi:hypothetical protein
MDPLVSRIIHFRGRDWSNARELVDRLLEREGTLADYIVSRLSQLAGLAPAAATSATEYERARAAVEKVRKSVARERLRLLRAEVSFGV